MKTLVIRTLVILLAALTGAGAAGPIMPGAVAAAGPDLIVQSISLSPQEPALDENITITVTLKNQGDAMAPSSFLTCYFDETILENRLTNSIGPGMVMTASFNWNAPEGQHTIKATADFYGSVAEIDETNNTGTYSFTTLAPDLIVQSITWLPASPSKGDTVTFSITVKNQGTYRSRYTAVSFYIDGSTRGSQDVPAIDPGGTVEKTYTWTAISNDHTLRAVIDEIDSTREADETNNDLSATFSTLPPDLIVRGIAWEPANPSKDDEVSFTITVANQGTGRSDACHLGYYIDNTYMSSVPVPAVNAGASCNVTFEWVATVDAHEIYTIVDYLHMVAETSETNNELRISMLTAPPDLIISNLTWTPVEAAAGDLVTLTAYLKNQGGGSAGGSQAKVYIDGSPGGYLDFPSLEAGGEGTAIMTWTSESGTHAFNITVDHADKITESHEDNNRYSTNINILPPDLIITGISYLPEKPVIGDTVTFTVKVKNQGQGRVTNFKVSHNIDGEIISVGTIGTLESGMSGNTTCTWIIKSGRYTYMAVADYDNALLEGQEKNNSATVTIAPDMADLAITNVNWSPPEIAAGQEILFAIDIENTGSLEAGPSRVAYYIDEAIAGFSDIGEINAGEKTVVEFSWVVAAGEHTLSIVADAKAQIEEIEEVNNTIVVNIPPPDLIVQDITFSTQEATAGDTVIITARVKNQGMNRAQNSAATCYVDGVLTGTDALPQIGPGEIYESSFTWAAEPGAHSIKVIADINNTVIEINETNNGKETIFSTVTPDLAVENISWLTDNQLNSKEVYFTVLIRNSGAVASGSFSIKYWFDDSPETVRRIGPVPGNGTAEFTFIAILAEGEHTANILLDAEEEVAEQDEANNESVLSFSTTAPDLVIRSITWSPLTAVAGDNITISAGVENRGGEQAGDVRVSLTVDGVETGSAVIPEVGAGATATADFSWTAVEGDHEIIILADFDGLIPECNETNNSKTRTISFAKPEAPVKNSPDISSAATADSSLLEQWWWALLMVGGLIGAVMLYTTIRNMRKR